MKPLAIALAVIFAVIAVLYWSGVTPLGHHVKHGIVFAILAVLALVWFRFLNNAAPARPLRR